MASPMDNVELLIGQLREAGVEVWIAGPQPEEAIAALEEALEVHLPPGYREFLARFGGLGMVNSFISGIIDGEPLGTGTGWVYADTQQYRQDFQLPAHLVVVQPDTDAPYCLDTSSPGPQGEFPLVCYELRSQHVNIMAGTFGEWFSQWLRSRAEDVD